MIAIEVSSGAGRPPFGGVGSAVRNTVSSLLALDPGTRYALCYRLSRWRRGNLFRPDAPNARIRLVQDPLNGLLLRGARLFHSMGIFMPKTPRVPKILTVHDLNAVRNLQWVRPEWHERRSARIRDALSRADHVVTYSAFTAGEVCEEYGLDPEIVHPVLLGVDADAFRPSDPEAIARVRSQYGDYVVSIGLLTPRKNFATLVRAVSRVPDLNLVLIGRDAEAAGEIRSVIEETGMRKRVVRRSNVSDAEHLELIGAARVCAVPSLYEGFGLTVLEAMACGTPVVCSTAASLPEAAGDAALLVDATDPEALTGALRRVVGDTSLAADLRARGLARAREMSWSASAGRLLAVYRQIAP